MTHYDCIEAVPDERAKNVLALIHKVAINQNLPALQWMLERQPRHVRVGLENYGEILHNPGFGVWTNPDEMYVAGDRKVKATRYEYVYSWLIGELDGENATTVTPWYVKQGMVKYAFAFQGNFVMADAGQERVPTLPKNCYADITVWAGPQGENGVKKVVRVDYANDYMIPFNLISLANTVRETIAAHEHSRLCRQSFDALTACVYHPPAGAK